MSDYRDRSYYPKCVRCDIDRMVITMPDANGDDTTFPAQCVVCPDCNGKGTYVNPSIDSHGLSSEDFDDDQDFREDYMSGRYDVQCRSCNGNRVILEPTTESGKANLNAILRDECESRACYEAERRMGC